MAKKFLRVAMVSQKSLCALKYLTKVIPRFSGDIFRVIFLEVTTSSEVLFRARATSTKVIQKSLLKLSFLNLGRQNLLSKSSVQPALADLAV